MLRNAEMLEKMAQSIRKNAIFRIFFRFWTFKKIKKIYKMDRKNEHQRFFLYFHPFQIINGLVVCLK
jgi:hypothetical protein